MPRKQKEPLRPLTQAPSLARSRHSVLIMPVIDTKLSRFGGGVVAPGGEPVAMDSEREPDVNIGLGSPDGVSCDEFSCSDGQRFVGESVPDGNGADGSVAGGDDSVAGGDDADGVGPAVDRGSDLQNVRECDLQNVREREIQDDRERRLRDLVTEVGFAGTFAALAGLARRWAEHPEVDARAAAELRLLGRRLDALVQDVRASTRLT